jgi:hypothetical protein
MSRPGTQTGKKGLLFCHRGTESTEMERFATMTERKQFPWKGQKSDGDTPPPVFLSKSAQAIEKKGQGLKKERQESLRVRKLLRRQHLADRPSARRARSGCVSFAGCAEVWQGKELGGLADTSWDIIPSG